LIAVDPAAVDFGTVDGTSAPELVTIENDGDADLVLGTITVSGPDEDDFEIQNDGASGATVGPGGDESLQILFTPSSQGPRNATLEIPSNDPANPIVRIPLTGSGIRLATIGSEITLVGEGFGTKKGKVYVQYVNSKGKTKTKSLKVLEWTDTEIKALWKAKLPAATYDLFVQTKEKGADPIAMGKLGLKAPSVGAIGANGGAPDAEITLDGAFFGDKKAKAKLYFEYVDAKGKSKRKKCKFVKDSVTWDPATGASACRFVVPKLKGLPLTGVLRLVNKVGEVVVLDGFTVAEAP
jgi:hypothetical protein